MLKAVTWTIGPAYFMKPASASCGYGMIVGAVTDQQPGEHPESPAPPVNEHSVVEAAPDARAAESAFGIDAFTLDDRLRLFHFAAAEKRHDYLWALRAFDRARANYQILLHASDLRTHLDALAAEQPEQPGHPEPAEPGDLQPILEALADWQVLDRSYHGTRAANLAEYRNRHYVYQFTQAGYRAYRAVEDVLGAGLEDAQLSRLVFPDILADLGALAEAVRAADPAEAYRKLSRLDSALADMAQRAARFYLMLGDLARTNDTRPEVFLAHKDALLTHMREFHTELSRYTPLLADAVAAVTAAGRAPGAHPAAELAAQADERLFRTPAERAADWRQRWEGLVQWFGAGRTAQAERLQDATVTAIANITALLRRVTESRKGGVSRESQLRHLAQWFTACSTDADAHTLFQLVLGLGAPRHPAVLHENPQAIAARLSWWAAPPVELRAPGARRKGPGPDRARQDRAQRAVAGEAARPPAQGHLGAPGRGRTAGRGRRIRARTR